MPFYKWTEAMSVGVPALDSDHKALIKLINSLHKDLELGEGQTELDQVFEQLIVYVDYHFKREESVMEACNYPATDAHREEHHSLAQEMLYFRDLHMRGGERQIGEELLDFLKSWLNHHVLIQDMHYKKYAEGNPQAQDAADRFGPGLSDPHWKKQPDLLNGSNEPLQVRLSKAP